jgi:hypothetical protein
MASYLLLTREVAQRHLAVVGFYCLSVATAVTAGTPPENPRRALDIENALRADTKLFHGFLPTKAEPDFGVGSGAVFGRHRQKPPSPEREIAFNGGENYFQSGDRLGSAL